MSVTAAVEVVFVLAKISLAPTNKNYQSGLHFRMKNRFKWALLQEKLSLWLPTRSYPKPSFQLQRIPRKLKFRL